VDADAVVRKKRRKQRNKTGSNLFVITRMTLPINQW
jgi:hypothetical protein